MEIELEGFRRLQRTAGRASGACGPRGSRCRCAARQVERTFEHRAAASCVNPDFLLSGADAIYTVTAARREGDGPG